MRAVQSGVDPADFSTAVVVPVYRQSRYLSEAVGSALTDPEAQVFVVSDGCPEDETLVLLRALARAHPGRVVVQRPLNGGLSSARNRGIRLALELNPSIRHVFPLDADNALEPGALAALRDRLDATPEASWCYPDMRSFGWATGTWTQPVYSRLRQMDQNQSDAGSLIRADVFRAGFWFDEDMKAGFEDWDLFMRLTLAGHVGVRGGDVGFRYRVKPVSMLTEIRKIENEVLRDMRRRNGVTNGHSRLLELETADRPRFRFSSLDGSSVFDVTDLSRLPRERAPVPMSSPSFSVLHAPGLVDLLSSGGLRPLFPGLMHALQRLATGDRVVGLRIASADDEDHLSLARHDGREPTGTCAAHVIPAPDGRAHRPPDRCDVVLELRVGSSWLSADDVEACSGGQSLSGCTLPVLADQDEPRPHHPGDVRSLIDRLPWSPSVPSSRQVAFVVPWLGLGGVDACVLGLAEGLRELGTDVHLVVTEQPRVTTSPDRLRPFSTVSWIVPGPDSGRGARLGQLEGTLSASTVVVNAHSLLCYELFERHRDRLPQVHLSYLHSMSLANDRPGGFPLVAARRISSVDRFLCISDHLTTLMETMDVPRGRIDIVPNAPVVAPVGEPPVVVDSGAPLQVLYAGRLDHDKGLERLLALIEMTPPGLAEFRIIGDPVLGAADELVTRLNTPRPHVALQPSTHDLDELATAYRRADVALNLSRAEGVPLAVLDAMASGCVVIATDVGAVREVVDAGVTGILVGSGADHTVATEVLDALAWLSGEREELRLMGERAWRAVEGRSWRASAERLLMAVDRAPLR